MRLRRAKDMDFFNRNCYYASSRFKELPEPLPWIEPSINMLYLESISSFVFGNFFSSIITMSSLLEHVLRLAIYDSDKCGLERTVSIEDLDKLGMLSALIKKAKNNKLIEIEDYDWWDYVAKVMRNKSAHYLLPTLLQEFTKEKYDEDKEVRDSYSPSNYKITYSDGSPTSCVSHDWGSFFHKSDYYISKQFIDDATLHITKIILKTNWKPDVSWWISQKSHYESFFKFDWSHENQKESLEKTFIGKTNSVT